MFLRAHRVSKYIENVTLALWKTRLTRTAPASEMAKTKSHTTTTTTTRAYRTLFKTTKVLVRSRPLSRSSTAAASLASRKFLWQARRKYEDVQLLERSRRRKLFGNVFRFDVWRA